MPQEYTHKISFTLCMEVYYVQRLHLCKLNIYMCIKIIKQNVIPGKWDSNGNVTVTYFSFFKPICYIIFEGTKTKY